MNKSYSLCIIMKRIELEIIKSIYFKMASIIILYIITLLNENILSVANTMFINHFVLQYSCLYTNFILVIFGIKNSSVMIWLSKNGTVKGLILCISILDTQSLECVFQNGHRLDC